MASFLLLYELRKMGKQVKRIKQLIVFVSIVSVHCTSAKNI